MKTILFLLALLSPWARGKAQTLSNKEASAILRKAWDCVRNKDSVSFAGLWSLNDAESVKHRRPHKVEDSYRSYNAVREFLDTAISRNIKMNEVEVEKMNLAGTDAQYWIQAWFKYDKNYQKGFGFYMAYFNGKWVVRDNPSTSWSGSPLKK